MMRSVDSLVTLSPHNEISRGLCHKRLVRDVYSRLLISQITITGTRDKYDVWPLEKGVKPAPDVDAYRLR